MLTSTQNLVTLLAHLLRCSIVTVPAAGKAVGPEQGGVGMGMVAARRREEGKE